MKDILDLRHPLLPSSTPELALGRQRAHVIQSSRHDIPELVHGPLPHLQDPTTACPAEFSVKLHPTAIVGFVDRGFDTVLCVGKSWERHFCGETEGGAEEFLAIEAVAERSAQVVGRGIDGVSDLAAVAATFVEHFADCLFELLWNNARINWSECKSSQSIQE